jgi:hypothetical protein
MKNYLKFIVVVAAITVASFSSYNAQAKLAPKAVGTCSKSKDICGYAGDNAIMGSYVD